MSKFDWKKPARDKLTNWYHCFAGNQCHVLDRNKTTEVELLRFQIAAAMFGLQNPGAKDFKTAYNEIQLDKAQSMVDQILRVYDKKKPKCLKVGITIVVCKLSNTLQTTLVVSLLVGYDSFSKPIMNFFDLEKNFYCNWEDFENHNKLPPCECAYPLNGLFTCSPEIPCKYNPEKDPITKFAESPQLSLRRNSRLFPDLVNRTWMFLFGWGHTENSSPVYQGDRRMDFLLFEDDEDSVMNIRNLSVLFAFVTGPFKYLYSLTDEDIKNSTSDVIKRATAHLNISYLCLKVPLFGLQLIKLINKYKENILTTYDALKFCISILFFTNTQIEPESVTSIIEQFWQFEESETDLSSDSLTERSTGSGSIIDKIKALRKIFKEAFPNITITIKGAQDFLLSVEYKSLVKPCIAN